jgi:cob(I)alamin adenosyltransferase
VNPAAFQSAGNEGALMNNDLVKKSRKGLNIFYYGKGKGKTTAVMGLAARAAGAGMEVFILQFVKSKAPKKGGKLQSGEWPTSSEILFFDAAAKSAKSFGKITTEQTGAGFVGILGDKKERATHVKEAKKGLALANKIIKEDKYDLIILDELVSALELELLSEKEILKLISGKPKYLHLAYTGHDKFPNIIAASDMVSEIKMIKHPYYKGILAQRGIDF